MPWRRELLFTAVLVAAIFAGFSAMAEPRIGGVYLGNIAQPVAEFASDRVLVEFAPSVTDSQAEEIVRGLKAKIKRRALKREFRLLSVPKGKVWQTIEALHKNPRVRYAHPDWKAYATFTPNDEFYWLQWHLDNPDPAAGGIDMEEAWDLNSGGNPDVTVAVVDTGIAYESRGGFCQAPDLKATKFVDGYDFVNNDAYPNDDNSHGTHVAGTIAQSTNNSTGVAGIAFNVSLMPVKVLGADGSGYISDIAEGIRWAADHGANVINMSFGTSAPSFYLTALQNAVRYAHNQGVLLVASSGNSSGATPLYPANYPEVIAVGATVYNKSLASYSNRGNELCAPGGTSQGEDLNHDGNPDMVLQNTFDPNTRNVCDFGYWFFAGTSMAAPHVSGVAALVLSENPGLTNEEIRQILKDTAEPADTACGSGLINAYAAVAAASPGDTPPQVSIVQPSDGSVVSGDILVQVDASDYNDGPGTLVVNLNIDEEPNGRVATYNAQSGFYEVTWDTTGTEDIGHTLQAKATDSAGQVTESTPVSVTVNNHNAPPQAQFTYSCDGSICDFDASQSSDEDGTIVSYGWDFGDGTTATGKTTSHTFTQLGTFKVKLTVTDDIGAEGSQTQDVPISQLTNTLHVADLDAASFRVFGRFWGTRVTIAVRDAGDTPVTGAFVSGVFSDGSSLFQCTTGASGTCQVQGYQYFLACLTFTVLDVSHPTLIYRPEENTDPEGDSNGTSIVTCRP
jgi:serine protease